MSALSFQIWRGRRAKIGGDNRLQMPGRSCAFRTVASGTHAGDVGMAGYRSHSRRLSTRILPRPDARHHDQQRGDNKHNTENAHTSGGERRAVDQCTCDIPDAFSFCGGKPLSYGRYDYQRVRISELKPSRDQPSDHAQSSGAFCSRLAPPGQSASEPCR